mgnify:CR=1 FL=1
MADRTSEIPKSFSRREQVQVLQATYKSRRDFIVGNRRRGKMGDEQYNIEMYNLAVLESCVATMRELPVERMGEPPAPAPAPPVEYERREIVGDGFDD